MSDRFTRGMDVTDRLDPEGQTATMDPITVHAPPLPAPETNGAGLAAPSADVEFDQPLGDPDPQEQEPRRRDWFNPKKADPPVSATHGGRKLDQILLDGTFVLVIDLMSWVRSFYYMARSWLIHHRWGQVSLQTYYKRRKHCLHCEFRQLVTGDDGRVREFCRHDTCGCGTKPNPVTGDYPDIEYKAALVNWECPLPGPDKRFGLGRAVTDPELEFVQLGVENRHAKQSLDREHRH